MAGAFELDRASMKSFPENLPAKLRFSSLKFILFNSIVCGLEFCASAGFTYIPPLLLKAGISEQWMGITLGIGPFLGFVFVPFIGHASDRISDKAPLGKRKPFILALCSLLFLTLIVIPHCGHFVHRRITSGLRDDVDDNDDGDSTASDWEEALPLVGTTTVSTILLCVSVVLFDFASQVCLSPCEALLSDISSTTQQNDQAFNAYSFMVSFGGCVGYFLSSIDWKSSFVSSFFPVDASQELISFSILTVLFLITVVLTFVATRESAISMYTNQKREANIKKRRAPSSSSPPPSSEVTLMGGGDVGVVETTTSKSFTGRSNCHASAGDLVIPSSSPSPPPPLPSSPPPPGYAPCEEKLIRPPPPLSTTPSSPSCCLLFFTPSLRGFRRRLSRLYRCCFPSSSSSFLSFTSVSSFLRRHLRPSAVNLPPILVPLMLAHFFSWSAMMALHIFYTDFFGRAIMDGDPNGLPESEEFAKYNLGIRVGSQGLFLNALVSMSFALIMDRMMERISPRTIWTSTLYLFVLCTAGMMFTRNVFFHFFLIGATGTFYAAINALPIAVIGEYHHDQALFYGFPNDDRRNSSSFTRAKSSSPPPQQQHPVVVGSLESSSMEDAETPMMRGIGADMALLDSAYFLSQVFITASLGYLSYWTGTVYSYIVFANVSAVLSILTLKDVVFNESDMMTIV